MKTYIKVASLLGINLLALYACGQKKAEPPVSSSSVTSSSSSFSTESSQKVSPQERYASVIEDFQSLLSQGVVATSGLHIPLNSWTIESISNFPDQIRYTFFDVNKDGVEEMLVSDTGASGKQFLLALYYLKEGLPTLLGETYAASHGGARNGVSLYQNGAILVDGWSSGTGNGKATVYQLAGKNGELTEVSSIDYQRREYQPSDLGLADGTEFDLSSLNWESFEHKEQIVESVPSSTDISSVGMDIQAIAAGDFSSIAGRWQNARGEILEFTSSGVVGSLTIGGREITDGFLIGSITNGQYGAGFYFVPAGVVIPSVNMGDAGIAHDASDSGRDRLLGIQYSGGIEEADSFYYRVD